MVTHITDEDVDLPTFEPTRRPAAKKRPMPNQQRRFTAAGPLPGCGVKRQFITEGGAMASIFGRHLERKLNSYRCDHCGYWHNGHIRTYAVRMGVPIVGIT